MHQHQTVQLGTYSSTGQLNAAFQRSEITRAIADAAVEYWNHLRRLLQKRQRLDSAKAIKGYWGRADHEPTNAHPDGILGVAIERKVNSKPSSNVEELLRNPYPTASDAPPLPIKSAQSDSFKEPKHLELPAEDPQVPSETPTEIQDPSRSKTVKSHEAEAKSRSTRSRSLPSKQTSGTSTSTTAKWNEDFHKRLNLQSTFRDPGPLDGFRFRGARYTEVVDAQSFNPAESYFVPRLIIEHKADSDVDEEKAMNQNRQYCVSSVYYLYYIGFEDQPVYGMYTVKTTAFITMTWYDSKAKVCFASRQNVSIADQYMFSI